MPKPSRQQLSNKMQERDPLDMRQQITPVDALSTERVERTDMPIKESKSTESSPKPDTSGELSTERMERTNRPSKRSERVKDPIESDTNAELSTERLRRTDRPNNKGEDSKPIKEMNSNTEQTTERSYTLEEPIGRQGREQRDIKAIAKTEHPTEVSKRQKNVNGQADASKRTVLQELQQGIEETVPPHTERYSFEIYPNQKDRIKEFQDLYQQKTGRKLSASRILREGLDMYLDQAFQLLNERM